MEDKKALAILMKMIKKPSLSAEEKEAILAAIGVLGWTSLAESKRKELRAKREKNLEWE